MTPKVYDNVPLECQTLLGEDKILPTLLSEVVR